jgi:hypothetical protein
MGSGPRSILMLFMLNDSSRFGNMHCRASPHLLLLFRSLGSPILRCKYASWIRMILVLTLIYICQSDANIALFIGQILRVVRITNKILSVFRTRCWRRTFRADMPTRQVYGVGCRSCHQVGSVLVYVLCNLTAKQVNTVRCEISARA